MNPKKTTNRRNHTLQIKPTPSVVTRRYERFCIAVDLMLKRFSGVEIPRWYDLVEGIANPQGVEFMGRPKVNFDEVIAMLSEAEHRMPMNSPTVMPFEFVCHAVGLVLQIGLFCNDFGAEIQDWYQAVESLANVEKYEFGQPVDIDKEVAVLSTADCPLVQDAVAYLKLARECAKQNPPVWNN